jgi:MutS domain I
MFRRPWSIPKCVIPNSHSFAARASFRKFSQSLNSQALNGSHVRSWLPRRSPSSQVVARGAKTRATVKLEDLAQGVIPLDPLPLEDGIPTYPTVVLQARSNMRKFENCVLLTRVGGFYELYFEQAEEFGPLLNLKVALKKTNAGPVSMVGVPGIQIINCPRKLKRRCTGWLPFFSA